LTAIEVAKVLELVKENKYSAREIAEQVGISQMSVYRIKKNSKTQPEYLQKLFDQNEHDT